MFTKDADEDNKTSTRHFSHGCHLAEGKMNHGMEDYVFAQHRKLNGYDLGLYAIFDGHAGPDVAKYLQNHLFQHILSEVYTLVVDILYIFQSTHYYSHFHLIS
jgi:protein phosphatase PTC2/3